eukprot:CAMPEP_0114690134 /NCGR_PEP_ID=MMETSP0191-20121206/65352_1 /TAXON_ID=126664 /ORGANISM="Sorites sp." /LENGTH=126 /DNA_ID=CAMNT_0001979669 /DNA_START=76 /DNA_END=456 /DNA_ORIENTATION=+
MALDTVLDTSSKRSNLQEFRVECLDHVGSWEIQVHDPVSSHEFLDVLDCSGQVQVLVHDDRYHGPATWNVPWTWNVPSMGNALWTWNVPSIRHHAMTCQQLQPPSVLASMEHSDISEMVLLKLPPT